MGSDRDWRQGPWALYNHPFKFHLLILLKNTITTWVCTLRTQLHKSKSKKVSLKSFWEIYIICTKW